jgi:integrase
MRVIHPYFDGLYLDQIDNDLCARVFSDLRDVRGIKNASVNRYIKLFKRLMGLCERKGWIDSAPHVDLLRDDSERVNWITEGQARRLIAVLPPNHAAAVRFALATGLRRGNIYQGLTWDHINIDRRIAWFEPGDMKSGRAHSIPLNADALDVLEGQRGLDRVYVFPYRPLINRQWKKFVKQAHLNGFRFHDLRHTWATWHVQRGTPLEHLMKLGDWSSHKMVLRYAHYNVRDLAPHAERLTLDKPE